MQEKRINLEEILASKSEAFNTATKLSRTSKVAIKGIDAIEAMKEAIQQSLELASENAKVTEKTIITNHQEAPYMRRKLITVVEKNSIINTIKQVECKNN